MVVSFCLFFLSMDGACVEILPPLPPGPDVALPINQRGGRDAHGPPGSARSGPARPPWFLGALPRVCAGDSNSAGAPAVLHVVS